MKTAVILTARKERDSAVPYPLLPSRLPLLSSSSLALPFWGF